MSQNKQIALNYRTLLAKVEALRLARSTTAPLTLIAVSKKQSVEAIEELYHLGQRDFGENYVQELVGKATELHRRGCLGIRWHFIGHLQTNKVKALIPWVSWIHTLDSFKLAQELAKRWELSGQTGKLPVFIEVNTDLEETKSGVGQDQVLELGKKIKDFPQLELMGLMCVPPVGLDGAVDLKGTRDRFRALAVLEGLLQPYSQGMLSMGMSGDYPVAIEEGATHIRVGSILFGARL